MTTQVFKSKKLALKHLKELRAQGKTVKLFRNSGVYTQPGKGIVSFCNFFCKEA